MERKVVFFASLGPGADMAEGFIFSDNVTNEELDNQAWEYGVSHAEMYGVYCPDPDPENEDDEGEGLHGYTWDDVEGYWEEYNAEKHDGQITYGAAQEPHWNQL